MIGVVCGTLHLLLVRVTLCPLLILQDLEAEKMLEDLDITKEAISSVEESGIVFIDEIDKIVSSGDYRGADASSEGVQRDLLPLIEVGRS